MVELENHHAVNESVVRKGYLQSLQVSPHNFLIHLRGKNNNNLTVEKPPIHNPKQVIKMR